MPTVSVLLPVFNGARYLAQAMDSVLAQTFADFELIVLDDGSTDGSLAIAQARAAKDSRVRIISRENRGLVASLNELLAAAQGKYLARMDADDICLPQRLERQVALLEAQPGIVCVGGAFQLIDERGRLLTTLRPPTADGDIQSAALEGHGAICHPSATLRREAIERTGGYRADCYPAEDLDLWLRLGEVGQLANLVEPVIKYRIHANSVSAAAAQGRQREAARRCCEDAWKRRGITDGRFTASAAWRPTQDPRSRFEFYLRYGWWAFYGGGRLTAFDYAVRAVLTRPVESGGWKLVASCLLKPRPAEKAVD